MSLLEARAASLGYLDQGRPVAAVDAIDLRVDPGEFLGILGPSGSGKSSLLYLLSGLKLPTSGGIYYRDQNLSEMPDEQRSELRLREFGFVFQQPYLLGYLTAMENVIVASNAKDFQAEAQELLRELGLGDKLHRHPHELSGGERQRVCVARSLIGGRQIVFADEPTAALDHRNGAAVVSLLNRLRKGGSLVMVTHDETMLGEADRIIRLAEGRITGEFAGTKIVG